MLSLREPKDKDAQRRTKPLKTAKKKYEIIYQCRLVSTSS